MLFPYPEQYRLALPPITTAVMVGWSLLGRALFGDGNTFILGVLLALFPLVIGLHLYLIWDAGGLKRLDQAFYGFIHSILAFVVWTFCIMHLAGNSFA
ncbi:hypothetical protein [Shewanella sp. YIC-542]|uniref:hypothetical protein n=1 Tax=Shewanella mytili TaxID=3377111 RepID=UPI00398E7AA6